MGIFTFGEKLVDVEYDWRPAVYGVIYDKENSQLAIIHTGGDHYFLPGGGIENGESHLECIQRECIEEMGMEVKISSFIGCARRYFFSENDDRHYLNEGYFYVCKLGEKIMHPVEEDHRLVWMDPQKAAASLFHEHQRWAVAEVLKDKVYMEEI